ncbi:MAG: DUF4838 domain-containing protein [Fimbriimonadaceae bacterium]|nr:DUF4838 domain-containing protein [Fimbriimonadaceae bacterium]
MPTVWLALALLAPGLPVVREGRPVATLVPLAATPERLATARLLQQVIRLASGAEVPIGALPTNGTAILLGRPATGPDPVDLSGLDGDGCVLQPLDNQRYVVAGPTEWGTEFGAVELLEQMAGARWLLPGEQGLDVPRNADLTLPATIQRQQPAYFSRLLSGLANGTQTTWARRLRMHGRVQFHHNLLHLFAPGRYYATRPEFFPVYDGRPYRPVDDEDPRWQPNFSAPGIVEEAVANITRYFRENPAAESYSLGINDTARFDERPESLAREVGRKNFLGDRDVSDSYYRWCNEVIEGVLREFPDKWFGCLAYHNVAEPPVNLRVHPRLIPYMTYDRHKWVLPAVRQQGEELTRRWHAQAPRLGWYDYVYGTPYCLPRCYPQQMAAALRFGRDQGVTAHYAEAYPNWGEGPKLYLYLKLQWNPDLDVAATLAEWYERCAGPAAAPLLAGYYALWERFWTVRAPAGKWFRGGQYLSFADPGYLAEVDPADLQRSRALLDRALALTATPAQRWRVGVLRDAFGYYEASAVSYLADHAAVGAPPATEAAALAVLEQAADGIDRGAARLALVDSWGQDALLTHPLPPQRYGGLSRSDWGGGPLYQLLSWAQRSPAVLARLEALGRSGGPALREAARALSDLAAGRATAVSSNPSVEEHATGWTMWVSDVGQIGRSDAAAQDGRWCLLATGLRRGGPYQLLPVQPGRYLATCWISAPAGQESPVTVALTGTMRGDDNVNLPSPQAQAAPLPGVWTPLVCPVTVPQQIGAVTVTRMLLCPIVDGLRPGEKVYLDAIALHRLPD